MTRTEPRTVRPAGTGIQFLAPLPGMAYALNYGRRKTISHLP